MHLLIDLPLSVLVNVGFLYGSAKVMTRDWAFHASETLYIILASLVVSSVRIFVLGVHLPNLTAHVFDDMMFTTFLLLYMPVVFLYFYKMKEYSAKQATILMALMMSIVFLSDTLLDISFYFLLPVLRLQSHMTPLVYPFHITKHLLFHALLAFVLSVLFVWGTKKLRGPIKRKVWLQNVFLLFCLMALFGVAVLQLVIYSTEQMMFAGGVPWTDVFVFFFMYALLAAVFLHSRWADQRRKREETEALVEYTNELERHQLSMRKFKHDYLNIFLSMKELIDKEDWPGLKQYYSSKIEPASEIITKDAFALDGLEKIKVPEIKSIFAAKLMMAQNAGLRIQTVFEANEEIYFLPIDSIKLVRMLGIMLDNAIEALAERGEGQLLLGCYTWEPGVTFIIQNTCRTDLPPLPTLWKSGFSTKGEGRGLGLPSLSKLIDSCPNASLKTSVSEGVFTHELLIANEEEWEGTI